MYDELRGLYVHIPDFGSLEGLQAFRDHGADFERPGKVREIRKKEDESMYLMLLAAAPTGQTPGGSPGAGLLVQLLPFALLFGFMWLVLIRPQKKQQETHRRMLAALKKGDRVVTAGGMVGEVTEVDEDEVRVRIADKTEAKFVKSSISRVLK